MENNNENNNENNDTKIEDTEKEHRTLVDKFIEENDAALKELAK